MDTCSTTIRPAWPDDLDAIAVIYRHYVVHTLATFELRAPDRRAWARRYWSIAEAGLPFLVVELGGRVAGYAYCAPWKPREAYRHTAEDSIYLAPWAAGRGLGTALLTDLVSAAGSAGVRELIAVIADTGDPASVTLHHRHGFTEIGRLRRVGFKHGRWLDTVLMQRSLHPCQG
jgi:L-amino acid N-acyltransferase YncA